MEIIDLNEEHLPLYLVCLEDWSEDMKESGPHKAQWFDKIKDMGLGVKLALTDGGRVGGMIHYIPIELSFASGNDLYIVLCIWVHGYKKKGIGNVQKRGLGRALLEAAEADVISRGAKGLAAWGISWPFWMKASWFKKRGYVRVDKKGSQVLLWKPFSEEARPPGLIREKKRPQPVPGRVTVTAFINGWCPAQGMIYERARRAAAEFGDRVDFREINTFEREVFLEWGISDGLFVDDRPVRTGPPPSYEKIRKIIAGKVKKL